MSVWSWLKLTVCLWLLRKLVKLTGWLLLAAAAVAAWPVTLVGLAGYVAAWLRGWPPVRLRRAAALCLPMTVVWLVAEARQRAWPAMARDPGHDWAQGWHHLAGIGLVRTFLQVAPVATPAGLGLAALGWAWRNYAVTAGIGGWLASAPITFDARQWKRQVRTARGRTAAPGSVPLLTRQLPTRQALIPVGGTIRTVGHRWHPVFAVPSAACARHMVIVGATGSGKTNLMMRLWAGWFTAALAAAAAGRGPRPLLVVLDCKGGRDARTKADRTRRLLYGAGARRVAIWPDEARLALWDLPPNDLAVLLYQMIDSGTGAAAYYADILQAVLTLAITAPGGPPLNASAFLDRLDVRWLQRAWGDGLHAQQLARVRGAARHLPDIQLRFATLLGRLGWPWTARGRWPTPTRGTSSWKAPASRRSPRPRPWPSPNWPPGPRPTRPPSRARCCSPPMTTAPCPAACRCPTCTSAAGRWASACRSRRRPGRASAPPRTSGTGSRPPPTAGSG